MVQLTNERFREYEEARAKTIDPRVVKWCEDIKNYCGVEVQPCPFFTKVKSYFNVISKDNADDKADELRRCGFIAEINGCCRVAIKRTKFFK